MSIIESVKKQGLSYYEALGLSINAAQHGCTFCGDAENLCGFLLDGTSTKDQLRVFIGDMQNIVTQAHQEALELSERFRSVRGGLFQVYQFVFNLNIEFSFDQVNNTYRSRKAFLLKRQKSKKSSDGPVN